MKLSYINFVLNGIINLTQNNKIHINHLTGARWEPNEVTRLVNFNTPCEKTVNIFIHWVCRLRLEATSSPYTCISKNKHEIS